MFLSIFFLSLFKSIKVDYQNICQNVGVIVIFMFANTKCIWILLSHPRAHDFICIVFVLIVLVLHELVITKERFSSAAKLLLGDVLKEGTPLSVNPLVLWAWAGLLINAINSIPAGETDGGRISFAIWGRKVIDH